MGLKLKLKPNEHVFLSGALVRNAGSGAVLEVMNQVPMLREKDILLDQNAETPCQKLYLIVQTLYFDESSRENLLMTFEALLDEVVRAAPSLTASLKPAVEHVKNNKFYPALKDLQKVIEHESKLIGYAKKSN